jgi:hypothetical protein
MAGARMDGPGFHVEIGTLASASAGIEESVADQKGSALSHLDRAESVYGHAGLHKSMENFCDRWSDGIDILTKDAKAIGDVLGKVAQAYQAADQAAAGRLTTDPGKPVVDG